MPKRKIFEELKTALEAALAHERGEQVGLRVTSISESNKEHKAGKASVRVKGLRKNAIRRMKREPRG